MKFILANWQIRILKLLILAISVIPLIWVIGNIKDNFVAGSQLGIVADGFLLVGALYIFGMAFSMLYSGNIATGMINFLLYPQRYLPKAPVITTRQKGLIAQRQYQLAETELCEMRLEHPDSPDVAMMLAELHASAFESPETAVEDIRYYISNRTLHYNKLHLTLSMRCADFLQQLGRTGEAAEFLRKESGLLLVYTARERKVLRQRAESLADEF